MDASGTPTLPGRARASPTAATPGYPDDIRQLLTMGQQRSFSLMDFHESTTTQSAKAMRLSLNKLVSQIHEENENERFAHEMDAFFQLFTRYLAESVKGNKLNWEKIKTPASDQIILYDTLTPVEPPKKRDYLSKLAVLKLNGGLGTTMGCVGPKSTIEVRNGMSFLDLTVRQIQYLNSQHSVNVPLILMNSFNTDEETNRVIQKYQGQNVEIKTFNQSRFPRIVKETLQPLPTRPHGHEGLWYPPGHGDIYESLTNSGLLDELLSQGIEYVFVSNIDNLGATVDTTILQHAIDTDSEFVMEVTDKTKADIKGGTLIDYDGNIRLLEIAQVPPEHVDDFKSIKKFKIFNTNNLWISLKAIKRQVEEQNLNLEIIVNAKTTDTGEKVLQLETAVGAAIKHFRGAHGVNVPRSRFLPVKSCSDLFLITSDLYVLRHGELVLNPKRPFSSVPNVKLGDHFKKVQQFLSRFAGPPHILELDHLTVTGDVTFGHDVTLRGTVIIVANHGERIDVPSGSILEDKVVSGNLRILDH
ncbi:UTP--glucose-1-phosphate uridylyltransferase-domain-containing protein [Polychytrium aggregatum]|uniref:UTP--glucose-1-phosphate uridylyltransferase-domain-containing protein n=1 Tax=Polychytrium aggregatum TaxID=110093 RepID=UPI0022FF2163|nr:UTP--glucose-1-phosphate uridylyltransferase-domain-containing protein [Polychytrium aggregatum]KAI9202935.1 UTP--glucose-1-phosphate uridylyltransferase-domain-containing protein [Polychytrium aggregatum]